ncbi:class I adenylate-forming enzyme family protein [Nocardia sp. NPDC056000]|uniref:class I adenylate-forming enzyme family protein n=1 Tax=Nocardia sp. NPDC056000 TaxID=3345674 RepID=UPI0035E2A6F9
MANIVDRIWQYATDEPERIALRTPSDDLSYGELISRAARFGGILRGSGLRAGDRMVLIAPTRPEFVIAYLGAQLAGVIVVTMNTMATAPEIDWVLADSEATLIAAWHSGTAASAAAAASTARRVRYMALTPDIGMISEYALPEPISREPDDTAVLLYTSGTTGKPKGVELTIANLSHTARVYTEQLGLRPDDRLGTGLPLFHVFGQAVALLTALNIGCPFSLLEKFTPDAMLELIRDHRLTVVAGVPTMWNAMLHAEGDFGAADLRGLRLAASGGAALPREVVEAFAARFGCTILEGYGLTESTGAATYQAPGRTHPPGSAGQALPGTDIEIRDTHGVPVRIGTVGEIHLRGPSVMKGYWRRADATAAELSGGWLRTGDLGYLDFDGYLFIIDRLKELIIRGGYNVYPREVEEVLYRHPGIAAVAVIGIPDAHHGEEVAAAVVPMPGHDLNAEQIRAWAKERLSAYKVPHRFAFVAALPIGPTGKVLKRAVDWDALTIESTGT